MRKIVFKLVSDEDGYPPVSYESVWGRDQSDKTFVIDNCPYYIYGVSKGDVVLARSCMNELVAECVVGRGGHSTLRVFANMRKEKNKIIDNLRRLGAICSVTEGLSLFSVDIPPCVDFSEIDKYLNSISDGESIVYEDACLQHHDVNKARVTECKLLETIPERLN